MPDEGTFMFQQSNYMKYKCNTKCNTYCSKTASGDEYLFRSAQSLKTKYHNTLCRSHKWVQRLRYPEYMSLFLTPVKLNAMNAFGILQTANLMHTDHCSCTVY